MAPSIWQLLIVLAIVLLLFGTKKLRNIGGDLGSTIKNFRSAMKEDTSAAKDEEEKDPARLGSSEAAGSPVSDENKHRDRA